MSPASSSVPRDYATSARLNGASSTGIGIQLFLQTGNALATAKAVRSVRAWTSWQKILPARHEVQRRTTAPPFVRISISQVAETLVEAIVLVFLVMFLFLQNFRYTIIPTIVVPVACSAPSPR